MQIKDLVIDYPIIVSMFCGEIGWFLQRYQGFMRYLRQETFKDHKMLLMIPPEWHLFVNDFVSYTVPLPDFIKDLDRDCYEAVTPNAPPGSLTDPKIYSELIKYLKTLYNNDKGKLILSPRGCNFVVDTYPQIFARYTHNAPLEKLDKPLISIMPRKRNRAPNRNVPEFIWRETVEILRKNFIVALLGTPEGAGLADVNGDGIINLIPYIGEDKTDLTIKYLNSSVCSMSRQSGGTHISLLSGCPTYIIGHEKDRHSKTENRLNIPVSFRYLTDYRMIDAQTICSDVTGFLQQLQQANYFQQQHNLIGRPSLWDHFKDKKDIVGVEIGVFEGLNSLTLLKALDIKKLYLVDPYDYNTPIAGMKMSKDKAQQTKEIAEHRLNEFADKIVWINKLSDKAINDINEELDFVYVDGNHKYEAVRKDIELYYPKIKDGGMMSFHDYDKPDENNGVIQAVEEYFKPLGILIHSGVCNDDPRTNEGWIIKSSSFKSIIDKDVAILQELIEEQLR